MIFLMRSKPSSRGTGDLNRYRRIVKPGRAETPPNIEKPREYIGIHRTENPRLSRLDFQSLSGFQNGLRADRAARRNTAVQPRHQRMCFSFHLSSLVSIRAATFWPIGMKIDRWCGGVELRNKPKLAHIRWTASFVFQTPMRFQPGCVPNRISAMGDFEIKAVFVAVAKIEADMKPLARTVATMEPIDAGYVDTRWKIAGALLSALRSSRRSDGSCRCSRARLSRGVVVVSVRAHSSRGRKRKIEQGRLLPDPDQSARRSFVAHHQCHFRLRSQTAEGPDRCRRGTEILCVGLRQRREQMAEEIGYVPAEDRGRRNREGLGERNQRCERKASLCFGALRKIAHRTQHSHAFERTVDPGSKESGRGPTARDIETKQGGNTVAIVTRCRFFGRNDIAVR